MADSFTAEEKAAMKEAAAEQRRAAKRAKSADKAAAELFPPRKRAPSLHQMQYRPFLFT